MHSSICMFVIVYIKNLKNEAFTTAKHSMYSKGSITTKWQKYQTVCYYYKTIALGKKEKYAA